jgi:hypothetical protein
MIAVQNSKIKTKTVCFSVLYIILQHLTALDRLEGNLSHGGDKKHVKKGISAKYHKKCGF